MLFNNNKRKVESFIVAGATTTMPTTGSLYNSSTGVVNLADGRLGVVATSVNGTVAMNNFVGATPTIDQAPEIAIYQGTSASANPGGTIATAPLAVRPYEKSNNINGKNAVNVYKQAFREGKHSIWAIGKPILGATGLINILDETEYKINVAFRGYRVEEFFSTEEAASTRASVTTPNFTATPSITHPIDWICNYLGWNINRNSEALNMPGRFAGQDPVVAMAVAASGGTAISGLTVGTFLPIVSTQFGTRGITLTQAMLDSITAAGTATGFTNILTIDLATAGVAGGGTAEGLFLMATDAQPAFVDYIPYVKHRLTVGVTAGFDYNTVYSAEVVKSDEGSGYGRQLDMWYKDTQGQRKYNLKHTEFPIIEYPSPVSVGTNYTVYSIVHGKTTQPATGNFEFSPFQEIICIPASNTTLITNWEALINSWLLSGDNQAIVTL